MSSVPEEINKEGHANTNSTTCDVDVKTDVQSSEKDILVASKHALKGRAGKLHAFCSIFYFSFYVL